MSGAFYSDLHSPRYRRWIDEFLRMTIKPIEVVLGVFFLALLIIYFAYVLSLLACSTLTRLGIIEHGLCSQLIG